MSRLGGGNAPPCGLPGERAQAIEKLDAVIQSTRLARAKSRLDSQNGGRSRPRALRRRAPRTMYSAGRKVSHPSKWNPPQMKRFTFRLSLSTPLIAAMLALLSLSAITSPAEAQASPPHRGLLPAADADAPSGRPAQRAANATAVSRPPSLRPSTLGPWRDWRRAPPGASSQAPSRLRFATPSPVSSSPNTPIR